MLNPTITIDQLIQGFTPNQIKAKIYDILSQLELSTTSWKPGGVARLIIAACSIVLSKLSQFASMIARSAFLSSSHGDWLKLVADKVYNTQWQGPTAAAGDIVFTNSGGGSFSYDIGKFVAGHTTSGATYRNTIAFTIAPTSTTAPIPFAADVTGSASNAIPGIITTTVTRAVGVTCTNPDAFVGSDGETEQALITRAMLRPQSLSPNGPRGAYQYFATQATRPDGSLVGVTRVTTSPYSSTGQVTITVASSSGEVPGSDLPYVRQALLLNCVPQGVTVNVVSATNFGVNVEFKAFFDANTTVPISVQQAIVGNAIAEWFQSLPIGGMMLEGFLGNVVPRDTIRDIISDAFVSAGYTRPQYVQVISPTFDLFLTQSQVPVLMGSVTADA